MTPCASCGTTEGYQGPKQTKPERYSGRPFGLPGMICKSCFGKCKRMIKRECKDCRKCGATGGTTPQSRRRHSGRFFGVDGVVCTDCYGELCAARKARPVRDSPNTRAEAGHQLSVFLTRHKVNPTWHLPVVNPWVDRRSLAPLAIRDCIRDYRMAARSLGLDASRSRNAGLNA